MTNYQVLPREKEIQCGQIIVVIELGGFCWGGYSKVIEWGWWRERDFQDNFGSSDSASSSSAHAPKASQFVTFKSDLHSSRLNTKIPSTWTARKSLKGPDVISCAHAFRNHSKTHKVKRAPVQPPFPPVRERSSSKTRRSSGLQTLRQRLCAALWSELLGCAKVIGENVRETCMTRQHHRQQPHQHKGGQRETACHSESTEFDPANAG